MIINLENQTMARSIYVLTVKCLNIFTSLAPSVKFVFCISLKGCFNITGKHILSNGFVKNFVSFILFLRYLSCLTLDSKLCLYSGLLRILYASRQLQYTGVFSAYNLPLQWVSTCWKRNFVCALCREQHILPVYTKPLCL